MADNISKQQRSKNMSNIHGKDTSLEVKVRKYLFSKGFRYSLNVSRLPGKPDIYLKKHNIVIFVNGCFWHHHEGCRLAYMPKSNIEFWQKKFNRNMENDIKNNRLLKEMGYKVFTVWECKLKEDFQKEMDILVENIRS